MIFDYSFGNLGLESGVLLILRIIACVGGAIVGWFISDPLTRLAYRLAFRGATPGWILPLSKLSGAALTAVLVFLFLPLGGLGLGVGMGGKGKGDGKGAGPGGGIVPGTQKGTHTLQGLVASTTVNGQEAKSVEIEIIGGKRFLDHNKDGNQDRYYIVDRKEPAVSIAGVEEYLKNNKAKNQVIAVLTKASPAGLDMTDSPLDKLSKLARANGITLLTRKE
jgi:hypothetical protein